MTQIIEYIIDVDGETNITAHGFSGGACASHVAAAGKPFAETVTEPTKTADFYAAEPTVHQKNKLGGTSDPS